MSYLSDPPTGKVSLSRLSSSSGDHPVGEQCTLTNRDLQLGNTISPSNALLPSVPRLSSSTSPLGLRVGACQEDSVNSSISLTSSTSLAASACAGAEDDLLRDLPNWPEDLLREALRSILQPDGSLPEDSPFARQLARVAHLRRTSMAQTSQQQSSASKVLEVGGKEASLHSKSLKKGWFPFYIMH
ncbi:unnamed protein product [Protopolystoma xenopodis]|uniref:Uncharacterized protein n=1 Tax=Protopolystoma xenopodis TaxID=117903 RepID=A0A448WNI7_9PLAT|nr:unnamed protein product [Protopolystoma xenopodis]